MKKVKICLMFFIVIGSITNIYTQEKNIKFNNILFSKKDKIWYIKDNRREFELVKDQIIVKVKNNRLIKNIDWKKYNLPQLKSIENIGLKGYFLLKIPEEYDIMEVCKKLSMTRYFETIEPDSYAKYHDVPNDSFYINSEQWNLDKMNMQRAWGISTGSSNVVVAIIDAGGAYNHQDLEINKNTAFLGYNFDDGSMNTDSLKPVPYDYHGTACAGLISAATNNSIGIASSGGGWNSEGIKLMYFQCAQYPYAYRARIQVSWVTKAINKAAEKNVDIISISLGFANNNSVREAINNAVNNKDIVVVVSAGNYLRYFDDKQNEWITEDDFIQFPGTMSNVITVGATVENDKRKILDDGTNEPNWGSCCYGSDIEVMAPGIHIPTTNISGTCNISSNNYIYNFAGTSASTPQVASIVGLILSVNNNLSFNDIKNILQHSCDWHPFMNASEYGSGRLNAYKALKYTLENYGGTLNKNLTITTGETWNFKEGTSINFTNNSKLIVNGELYVEGNANNKVIFNFGGSGGIEINSNGEAEIEYAEINNGTVFRTNESSVANIENTLFNGTPLENVGGELRIYKCEVKNSTDGPAVRGIMYSETWFSNPTGSKGYNNIHNNLSINPCVLTTSGSYIFGGNSSTNSHNIVINPNSLYAESGSSIYAVNNYWGGGAPTVFGTGTIYYTPYLTVQPSTRRLTPKDTLLITHTEANYNRNSKISEEKNMIEKYIKAVELIKKKDYFFAEKILMGIVRDSNDDVLIKHTLKSLFKMELLKKNTAPIETIKNILVQSDKKHKYEAFLCLLKAESYITALNYAKSIEEFKRLSTEFPEETRNREYGLYQLCLVNKYFVKNNDLAEKYALTLLEEYPESRLSEIAISYFDGKNNYKSPNKETYRTVLTKKITLTAYPNPFNPVTKISYTIPKASYVKLEIYNSLGEKVETLVNETKEAGSYTAHFNGANFASGVYIYRLQTNGKTISKKMILMK